MLWATFLWTGLLVIVPATAGPPEAESSVLTRLVMLERLVFDHHAQFQHERRQWQKDKQVLVQKIHLLEQEVQNLQKGNEETRTQAQTPQDSELLTTLTENEDLKAVLGHLQHQIAAIERRRQSVSDLLTQYLKKPRSEGDVNVQKDQQGMQAAGEQSQPVAKTSEHHHDLQHVKNASLSLHRTDLNPFLLTEGSQRTQTARSDDGGPLQMVVDHLGQQMIQLTADVRTLKTSDAERGSTFIHWGSSSCSDSSELVYSGVLGGSLYSHTGAAANALCLSSTPRLQDPSSGVPYTLLYGGEYQTYDSHMDRDAVCAMCRSPLSATFMVPGTNACPSGWTLQYSGFLMAGHYTHEAATQFICVDGRLESRPGSGDNHDGYILYFTKTQCGSLPCSPYENDKVVTCAVCSK